MKRKLLTAILLAFVMCIFALTVSAACTEHTDSWTVSTGENGYLSNITAVNTCSVCSETVKAEMIKPLFHTLGYSYSEMGGITQHYAADRNAIARYEELTGEKIRFGAVAAVRSNVSGNPLNEKGEAANDKVRCIDFTDTKYDIFDVIVNGIPEEVRENAEIICCAYIIVGNEVTYIDGGVEKMTAKSNSFKQVTQIVDNHEKEAAEINQYKIINGQKYMVYSLEDLVLSKYSFWQTDGNDYKNLQTGTSNTHLQYFATRRFTKDELPNGTIISVASGWKYRPEGWITENTKNNGENSSVNPRPKTVSNSVVVDDAWWGNFTLRAFNITPGTSIPSTTTAEDIYEIFQIYVPVGAYNGNTAIPPMGDVEFPFDPTFDTEKQDWEADGALKILCIGNSFSVDSMEYVYQVAKAAGVSKVVLGNLYIGGCSLATHLSNASGDKAAYTYYYNTDGKWTSSNGYKISTAVQSDDWDFITFQQVSGNSGIADTYDTLTSLIDIVEPLNPSARLVWHMTWAYQSNSTHSDFSKYDRNQMTMYNAIVNAVQTKIVTNDSIEIIIPAGTAIQNVRTSYVGDTLTRDGYHLSNDYGRYIGSLTFVKALTGLSIDKMSYKPSGVTDEKVLIAIEAVNNAVANPFAVTNSSYTKEPEVIEPEIPPVTDDENGSIEIPDGYRQLTPEEMGWQESSYWNGKAFTHKPTEAFSNKYYATVNSFTRETLPVGSIIILKQGESWQYRPDGWGSTPRPGNVTTETVVVTEAWWGNFTNRVFNLSKTTNVAINTFTPEEIYNVLVILVPTNDGPQSAVTSDMCVDEITVIDGIEYKALTAEAMGLTNESFYWSSKGEGLYLDDQELAKSFFSTAEFDRTVLVIGAVIWVDNGWQYRPEGWDYTGSRPGNTSTEYVTVDNTWWSSYIKRAFNVSMTDSSKLVAAGYDTVEELYSVFKIYIPVDKIAD